VTVGDLIAGRYAIVSELARGGMGAVFRVDDRSTGRPLALKRSIGGDPVEFEANGALLEREYRTLVWLRHPCIIQVHDFGVDEHGSFYTMELLDGADLRARSPLDWKDVCAHLRDVASSLALLHSRRLVHRDVTARNIRLTGEGRAKLIDFGALASFGKCSVIAGTPTSVAPEALEGRDIDHRVDLFALGAVAYYALTGQHAYPANDMSGLPAAWARGLPPPPSARSANVPRKLDELVLALLSLDRALRPSSAAEVMDRLCAIAGLPPEKDVRVARSYLVSQELIGREREVARVSARLERALTGRGSALVFEAAAGLGKSTLLDRSASEARVSGAAVLQVNGRAHPRAFGACRALVHLAIKELGERAASAAATHGIVAPESLPPPETGERLPREGRVPRGDREQRFVDLFLALSATTPLAILVDDLHCVDSLSLSVFTRLAKAAVRHPVLLVATIDADDPARNGATLTLFRRSAVRMRLRPFTDEQTTQLVCSIFGDVASTKRLGAWLQLHTAGSPSLLAELLAHLVDQGRIQYAEGTWVLPNELPDEDVQAIVTAATRKRLERLPADMLRLAECLSPHYRGSFDLGVCRALREFDPTLANLDIDGVLEDLVYERVLVGDQGDYAFAQPRVRDVLYAGLDEARRRQLHAFAAKTLAAKGDDDPERAFEVGCHLLAAGDPVGARARIGPSVMDVVSRPDALVRAVPQLRELQRLYRSTGASSDEQLAVIGALVVAGYYVDPKCHDELGDRAARLLQRKTGFHIANRLLWLGSYPAIFIGLLCGFLGVVWQWLTTLGRSPFAILPHGLRNLFPSFVGVMHAFVGVCAARSAVAYLRLEPRTHEYLLSLLAAAGRLHQDNGLRLVHDLFPIGIAEIHGDFEKAYSGYQDQLRRIPRVRLLTDDSRHHYEAGILCSLGRVAILRVGDLPLECADRVDAMGGEHVRVLAQALRRAHYLYRGETNKAQQAEEQLDAMAARYGYRWVADALAVLDFVPHHLAADIVGLKRVLHRTQQLLPIAPTLSSYMDILRAMYEGHRGQPERALALYEELTERVRPFTHPAWSYAHAHRAECLNAVGRHQEALLVCEEALRAVGQRARVFVLAYQQLERESAIALAGLGRTDEAAALLDELLELHRADSHPLLLGLLHRDRARVARIAGEEAAFGAHCQAACAEFVSTGNPTLLAQARRLAGPGKPGRRLLGGLSDEQANPEVSLLHSVAGEPLVVVAERALEHVAKLSGASQALLYTVENGLPVLAGSFGGAKVHPTLVSRIEHWLAGLESEITATSDRAVTSQPSQPADPALLPLVITRGGQNRTVGVVAAYGCQTLHDLTPDRLSEIAAALRGSAATAVAHKTLENTR
jgi:tetratricopeptide (TPR) repeat protein